MSTSEINKYIIEFYEKSNPKLIESIGGIVRFDYENIPELLSAELTLDQADRLFDYDEIKDVRMVRKYKGAGESADWGMSSTLVYPNYKNIIDGKFVDLLDGTGVNIAILDTGIAYHEDLPIATNFYNFVGSQQTQFDNHGHGTFIAGIIAAQTNGIGYVGIAPKVKLFVGKVLDANAFGTTDEIIAGLNWAISQRVDIINFSIGTMNNAYDADIVNATRRAYDAGIIVVACSGNGTLRESGWDNIATNVTYPARDYSCVAAGSINISEVRSSFSNYGLGLDLVAPGEDVINAYIDNDYVIWSGTSFATSYVVGHLAILKQLYPNYSRDQLITTLYNNCKVLGSSSEYGHGLVKAQVLTIEKIVQDVNATTESSIIFSWTNIGADYYDIYVRQGTLDYYKATVSTNSSTLDMGSDRDRSYDVAVKPFINGVGLEATREILHLRPTTPVLSTVTPTITSTSVKFYWRYMGEDYDNYGYWLYWKYSWESESAFRHVASIDMWNLSYTFTNLSPETSYTFRVKKFVQTSDGASLGSLPLDVTYTTNKNRPSDWTGFTTIASGQPVTNLTYTEWNNFLSKINEFEVYHHGSSTDFTGYKPLYSGQDFFATYFNKAREAVGSMNATGITTKYAGDKVLASYFQTLKTKLNGIT